MNYWSLSSLADWIRQKFNCEKMPFTATKEEWEAYQERNKNNIGYRLAESLDTIQDAVMWIPRRIEAVRAYLKNRFDTEVHVLHTGLPVGHWFDLDTRITHALFYELFLFVCNEKGGEFFAHDTGLGDKEWALVPQQERFLMGLKMIELQIQWNKEEGCNANHLGDILEIVQWWVALDKNEDWEYLPETTKYLHTIIDIRKGLWT